MIQRVDRTEQEHAVTLEQVVELLTRNARLLLGCGVLGVLLSLAWMGSKDPVYRARATLILEDDSADGVLGELAALTSAPQAAAEIEVLRARTTAEEALRSMQEAGEGADPDRHLGLTTLIEDPGLRPFRGGKPGLLGLQVRFEGELGSTDYVRVHFPDHDETIVEIASAGTIGFEDAQAHPRISGQPFEHDGAELTLTFDEASGLAGKTYEVVRLDKERALRRVMKHTRVRETERNSGVIELTFDDSHPERAAATANALVLNYLARNESRGRKRASQTLAFIEEQLADQKSELENAEEEVVELQRLNPRAVDVSRTAEVLIDQLAELEVERVRGTLTRRAVEETLVLIDGGDPEALARLSAGAADPIAAAYIESLVALSTESELLERSDAGAYKALLQGQALELESAAAGLDPLEEELTAVLKALEAGDDGAIARLTGSPGTTTDPLLSGYVELLAELQGQRAALGTDLKDNHPDVQLVDRQLASTTDRIREVVAQRLGAIADQRTAHASLLERWEERATSWSGDERGRIQAASVELRGRTRAHLEARLGAIAADEAALSSEVSRIEELLGSLPTEERELADPKRRLAAHAEIVTFLLKRQQEAAITEAATVATADYLDPAVPPTRRHGPSLPVHLILGMLAGGALATVTALFREIRGRKATTSNDLEQASGLQVVGTVPDFQRGKLKVAGAHAKFVPLRDDPREPPRRPTASFAPTSSTPCRVRTFAPSRARPAPRARASRRPTSASPGRSPSPASASCSSTPTCATPASAATSTSRSPRDSPRSCRAKPTGVSPCTTTSRRTSTSSALASGRALRGSSSSPPSSNASSRSGANSTTSSSSMSRRPWRSRTSKRSPSGWTRSCCSVAPVACRCGCCPPPSACSSALAPT